MKIFNWVQRRFTSKAENATKNGVIAGEDIDKFPAESKCNSDAFEQWSGGILTIGTFGYDPLLKDDDDQQQLKHYSFEEEDDDADDDEKHKLDDEHNPLVVDSLNYNINAEELAGQAEIEENWSHEEELQLEFEYVMIKKEERTTLADLFIADSQHDNCTTLKKKKTTTFDKPVLVKEKPTRKSFRKKLVANDLHPIHKVNQLMRRMLKRKIHPDAGLSCSRVVNNNTTSNKNANNGRTTSAADFSSLLPSQDANI